MFKSHNFSAHHSGLFTIVLLFSFVINELILTVAQTPLMK